MEIPRLCAQPFSPISAWAVFSVFPKQAEWFKKKGFCKQNIIYQLCSFEQTTHLISLFLLPASSSSFTCSSSFFLTGSWNSQSLCLRLLSADAPDVRHHT